MAVATTLESLRVEFPVTETWAYLNHATHGPFSRRTVEAINQVALGWTCPPTMAGAKREAAQAGAGAREYCRAGGR